jgi:hypothetical protein
VSDNRERDLEGIAARMAEWARAEAEPPRFSPFREAARRWAGSQAAARLAEREDRERWIADVKRRLGLVGFGELGYRIETAIWFREHCMPGCDRTDPHDGRVSGECAENGERIFRTYEEAWVAKRVADEAFVAALPGRAAAIAEQLSALLPDGLRFEWVADGE